MLIIWRGLGFLPVIFMGLFGWIFIFTQNGPVTDFSLGATIFLTGLATSGLDWFLRRPRPQNSSSNTAEQDETAQAHRIHALLFIPLFYWGPVFTAVGAYLLLKATLKR
jgi:hypothetical protein